MTIDEYKAWVATRGDNSANWDYHTCLAADALIMAETVAAYEAWADQNISHALTRVFCKDQVRLGFLSFEVTNYLKAISVTPDWVSDDHWHAP